MTKKRVEECFKDTTEEDIKLKEFVCGRNDRMFGIRMKTERQTCVESEDLFYDLFIT